MNHAPISYHHKGRNILIPSEFIHLVRIKYREELAHEYDLKPWTFRRELKRYNIDIPSRRPIPIHDVLEVYLTFGWPPKMRVTI